jgi:hypothetical protein
MMILPDGVSVICSGLDHWFKHESGDDENIDRREYQWMNGVWLPVSAFHTFTCRQIIAECTATSHRPTATSLFHSCGFRSGTIAPVAG